MTPMFASNAGLLAWRTAAGLSQSQMAQQLSATPTAQLHQLNCDQKLIWAWEHGRVTWPTPRYRQALHELTGHTAEALGFIPPPPRTRPASTARRPQPGPGTPPPALARRTP
jgi:transcriptional regulator with XRE-family HTH domain